MDTKNLSLLFKTSFIAATMSMVVGCSSSTIPGLTGTAATESEIDSSVETAAKSGTIVTVADPYAIGCSVTLGGLEAVEIDPENSPGKYMLAGKETGTLRATGCIDGVSGISLPPLASYFDDDSEFLTETVVTPITTAIEGFRSQGLDIAQARTRTATLLGISEDKLESDPVKSATDGDAETGAASSKLTAIAKAFQKSGQADPIAELAKATKDSTDTIDNEIQKDTVINAVITDTTKRATAKTVAKVVADAITTATKGNSGVDTLKAAAKIIKKASTSDITTLTDADTLVNDSIEETISDKGLKTSEINTNSAEFTKAVTKLVNKVKADPENTKVIPAAVKTTVTAKVTELKQLDATVAAQIKATASSEAAKEDQAKADAKVSTIAEADVKAELEKAAAAAKAAAEAAAAAAAEAAAATDAAAAEVAAAKATEEAGKAAEQSTSSGAVATN